jgi:hypothetical protein
VQDGISAAGGGGSILLIRAGAYPENLPVNAPVTLRATRAAVRIGQGARSGDRARPRPDGRRSCAGGRAAERRERRLVTGNPLTVQIDDRERPIPVVSAATLR